MEEMALEMEPSLKKGWACNVQVTGMGRAVSRKESVSQTWKEVEQEMTHKTSCGPLRVVCV